MNELRNIPKITPQVDQLPLSEREKHPQKQGLKFSIEGQSFDFKDGKIILNNQILAQHLKDNLSHLGTHYWTAVARHLGKYRDWAAVSGSDPEQIDQLFGLISAFLTKIYGRVKKKFDETEEGIGFVLDEEGQFLLNGVNVGACIKMVKRFPQRKEGRIFLKGLRRRLAILQENRSGKGSYEKVRDTVNRLAKEIDQVLGREEVSVISLPAPKFRRLP